MAAEFYEVRFHFPNYSLTLDKVPLNKIDGIRAEIRMGRIFEVDRTEDNTVQINPALVTHVEYNVWRPF